MKVWQATLIAYGVYIVFAAFLNRKRKGSN